MNLSGFASEIGIFSNFLFISLLVKNKIDGIILNEVMSFADIPELEKKFRAYRWLKIVFSWFNYL